MVQILGDICHNGARKDCQNKNTCFYRHTNEIVGKDIEYYTRSLSRAAKVIKDTKSINQVSSEKSIPHKASDLLLNVENCFRVNDLDQSALSTVSLTNTFRVVDFVKKVVPGDGHCIIHSVLTALKHRHNSAPTLPEVLGKLKPTLQSDMDLIAPFINSNKTDPLAEIDAYVELANYNSSIVDLIIPLISKILNIGICVMQLDVAGLEYVTNDLLTFPASSTDDPLYVLKTGSHYDALLPKSESPTQDSPIRRDLDDNHKSSHEHTSDVTISDHCNFHKNEEMSQLDNDDDVFFDCGELSELLDMSQGEINVSQVEKFHLDPTLDPKIILASLCAKAPDLEVRDLLRTYSPDNTLKYQTGLFNKWKKSILLRCAEYLKVINTQLRKPDIIHSIICKIQNLLPDECQVCKKKYVFTLEELPFLACHKCGQEVHKPCFEAKIGVNSDCVDIKSLINPLNLPGIHYLCHACETNIIPKKFTKSLTSKHTPMKTQLKTKDSKGKLSPTKSPLVAQVEKVPDSSDNPVKKTSVSDTSADISNTKPAPLVPISESPSKAECEILTGTDPQFQSSLDSSINKSPLLNKENQKICVFYRNNRCKYGIKGKGCPFLHPERCKKLMKHGTRQPNGCNLGKSCTSFHPKLCDSSITKKICYDDNCTHTHIKGTQRKRPNVNKYTGTKEQTHNLPPKEVSSAVSWKNTDSNKPSTINKANDTNLINTNKKISYSEALMSNNTKTESQDFLGAIHLLKQELSEVIETKIALAINQMTHHKVQASPTYLFPPIPNYRIQKNQYPIYMPPQQPYLATNTSH